MIGVFEISDSSNDSLAELCTGMTAREFEKYKKEVKLASSRQASKIKMSKWFRKPLERLSKHREKGVSR